MPNPRLLSTHLLMSRCTFPITLDTAPPFLFQSSPLMPVYAYPPPRIPSMRFLFLVSAKSALATSMSMFPMISCTTSPEAAEWYISGRETMPPPKIRTTSALVSPANDFLPVRIFTSPYSLKVPTEFTTLPPPNMRGLLDRMYPDRSVSPPSRLIVTGIGFVSVPMFEL